MIKRVIFHILLSAIFTCISSHGIQAKDSNLRVGISTGYPPYYYHSEGEYRGVCIEIIENICAAMDLHIKYIEFPWKRLLLSAQRGEVDAILPLFKTPQREKYLNFGNLILAYEEVNFFVKKDSQLQHLDNREELFQHLIGVVSGYSYGDYFDSHSNLKTVVTQNDRHLLKMFIHNRFPVGIGNRFVVAHNAILLGVPDDITYLDPPVSREPLYMGFTKKGEKEHLTGSFGQMLEQFKKSEKYQKIIQKYRLE